MKVAACLLCSLQAKCPPEMDASAVAVSFDLTRQTPRTEGEREAIGAMKWGRAWKWMIGLFATFFFVVRASVFQTVLSILVLLVVACAILILFAFFSAGSLQVMSRALDFVEPRVRAAVDRTRTIVAHSFHHLPACADPRQRFFLLLPTLAKGTARGVRSLQRLFRARRGKFVQCELGPEQ